MIPHWTFGDRLRRVRREAGLTQAQMAARLGCGAKAYASWEIDVFSPRDGVAIARRLEALTGVPAAWILGVEPRPVAVAS